MCDRVLQLMTLVPAQVGVDGIISQSIDSFWSSMYVGAHLQCRSPSSVIPWNKPRMPVRAAIFVGLRGTKHRADLAVRATRWANTNDCIVEYKYHVDLAMWRDRPMWNIQQITTMESVSHLPAILASIIGVLCLVRLVLTGEFPGSSG